MIVLPLPTVAASSLLRGIIAGSAVGVGEGDLQQAGEGEGSGRGAATVEVREGQGSRGAERVRQRRHKRGDRGGGEGGEELHRSGGNGSRLRDDSRRFRLRPRARQCGAPCRMLREGTAGELAEKTVTVNLGTDGGKIFTDVATLRSHGAVHN